MLISIIVPIYNAEKFIDRVTNSIACQLTEEMELLLVDDGSTDHSARLCDEYAKSNPFIRVIHKQNGGSSSARNAGIRAARGEYISFVDADDYVDATTYQRVINVIKNHHPDCIDFGWRYISCSGDASTGSSNKVSKDVLLGIDMIKNHIIPTLLNLREDRSYFVYDFVWNKLYRRDKIISNDVMFSEARRTWEDRPFLISYLRYCENYYSMSDCFYNYVCVPDSKSQRFSIERLGIIVDNYCRNKSLFGDEYDFDTQYVNNYWCHAIESMILIFLKQKHSRDQIEHAVLNTLKEEQVIHWFSKRVPENKFEKETSKLVTAGKAEEALRCYKKKVNQERRRVFLVNSKNQVKRSLRKILGRG